MWRSSSGDLRTIEQYLDSQPGVIALSIEKPSDYFRASINWIWQKSLNDGILYVNQTAEI